MRQEARRCFDELHDLQTNGLDIEDPSTGNMINNKVEILVTCDWKCLCCIQGNALICSRYVTKTIALKFDAQNGCACFVSIRMREHATGFYKRARILPQLTWTGGSVYENKKGYFLTNCFSSAFLLRKFVW